MSFTPKQARDLLVDALKSDIYKQGIGVLRRGDFYCVLGVACDVYHRHVGGEWEPHRGDFRFNAGITDSGLFDKTFCLLPEKVRDWYAFEGHTANLQPTDEHASLADLNDGARISFAAIATYLEEGKVA